MLNTIYETIKHIEDGINHACSVSAMVQGNGLIIVTRWNRTTDRQACFFSQLFSFELRMPKETHQEFIAAYIELANAEVRKFYAADVAHTNEGEADGRE